MGMRCLTGEKSDMWHLVAKELNLPTPSHDDGYYVEYLDGHSLTSWFDKASVVKYYFYSTAGRPVLGAGEFLLEADPDGDIRADIHKRPLLYGTFMRMVGLMEADMEKYRERHDTPCPDGEAEYAEWEEQQAEIQLRYKFVWA